MGIVSGGGGGGGTVAPPVTLTGTSAATTPLTVKGATLQSADIFVVSDTTDLDAIEVTTDGAGNLSSTIVRGVSQVTIEGNARTLLKASGVPGIIEILATKVLFEHLTATPAAVLSPSQFGLWLDDTNGASKLMVAAQSADGSAVSAAIALA